MDSLFVIEWTDCPNGKDGFMSYGRKKQNGITDITEISEYAPVPLPYAKFFESKEDAGVIKSWYASRGGFGKFKVKKVVLK